VSRQKEYYEMKYKFLQAWVKEMQNEQFGLESIQLLPDLFVMQLKGGKQLCINLLRKDSFPFICPKCINTNDAKALWQRLKNASLTNIRLVDNDRILHFELEHKDIYQQLNQYIVIAELMPPQPNVILLSGEGIIIDALYKYTYADNPQRQVLPNLPYTPPKTSFVHDAEESLIDNCNDYFMGQYFKANETVADNRILQHNISALNKELKKLNKKLTLQKGDLETAEKADYWLSCAEGLKPHLKEINQGDVSFRTIDYLDSELKEITILLLPDKSPHENLKLYIKKYHKAKNGFAIITINIAKTSAEIMETSLLLERVQKGELPELNLEKQGTARQILSAASTTDKLLNIKLGDEYQIVIGRKAKENDFITTQLGKPHDYWFHSRIYHGAHVLLRCFKKQEPGPELINLCCNLAAGYSKAKNSANVPVDYTQIRYVRKPRKSAPGLVIYTNHHSVYATPIDIRAAREQLCIK